jgi:hypothetical protein
LLAAREPCRERCLERCPDPFERRGVPARHDHHVGLAGRCDRTLRQLLPAITSTLSMNQRLERRRGGAEHHRHAALPRAPDRDVAAMVANAILLLERGIVLFVDDDEPEARQRCKDREPRPEDKIGHAARRLAPVAQALAGRKPAVQRHGSLVRQRSGEALPELRREVDFRHEDQHLPAGGHALGGGGDVHLGLAAAGDALEQEGRERSGRGDDGRCGVLLIGIERLPWRRFGNAGIVRLGSFARRSDSRRRCGKRGQHLRKHEPHRFLVVPRDEVGDFENVGGQWRHVLSNLDDRLQLLVRHVGLRYYRNDDARENAAREAHAHHRAWLHGESIGNPVVERARRRNGKGNACDRHGVRVGCNRRALRGLVVCEMLNMSAANLGKSLVYNGGGFWFTTSVDKLVGNPLARFRPARIGV